MFRSEQSENPLVYGPEEPSSLFANDGELHEAIAYHSEENSVEVPPLPINGLLNPVDLEDRRVTESFRYVIEKITAQLGGVVPEVKTVLVENPYNGSLVPRIVVRFECSAITDEQLALLEEVARRSYGSESRGTKTKNGRPAATHLYPKLDARGRGKSVIDTTIGWYLGELNGTPSRLFPGIFVYRQIGKKDIASGLRSRDDGSWFTQETLYDNTGKSHKADKYIVEIREKGTYTVMGNKVVDGPFQTDLAEQIAYISLVLAGKQLPPEKPGLLYEIYHEMNQIGLGPATQLPGLESQIEQVKRTLIIPLASPELARALKGNAKSVGLVGQVGTGKTQIIKQLLRESDGVMMVPIHVQDFERELQTPPEYRTILPRIREVAERVGKSIVLIIEDLENLAHQDNPVSKLLLNELAGLYNSGYRILWTTNHIEVFNPQLLEPERLGGSLIFAGLPNLEARRLIIEQHLLEASRTLNLPLYEPSEISEGVTSSVDARDRILDAVAVATHGFTPRFLKDIVVEAISNFMYRIAQQKSRLSGLTEEDLRGQSFTKDDWSNALTEVLGRYDAQSRIAEDLRLQDLVQPGKHGRRERFGFPNDESNASGLMAVAQFQKMLQDGGLSGSR